MMQFKRTSSGPTGIASTICSSNATPHFVPRTPPATGHKTLYPDPAGDRRSKATPGTSTKSSRFNGISAQSGRRFANAESPDGKIVPNPARHAAVYAFVRGQNGGAPRFCPRSCAASSSGQMSGSSGNGENNKIPRPLPQIQSCASSRSQSARRESAACRFSSGHRLSSALESAAAAQSWNHPLSFHVRHASLKAGN